MKRHLTRCLAVIITTLTGCTTLTPINQLPLPPVTRIEGTVTQLDENGFQLKDPSGSIFVKAKLPNTPLGIAIGDKLRVCGNLQGGVGRVFDGYVIQKPTGEQIIITRPTPHIGFIIQTAF